MADLRIRRRGASPEIAAATGPAARVAPGETTLGLLFWAAAVALFLLAFALRFYNVSWDENTHLHPDERHLTIVATEVSFPANPLAYFDSDSSPLNPYNRPAGGSFVYGTLPLFLTKLVAGAFGQDNYDHLNIVGRYLTALFDFGTVLLIFLTGRRLYGRTAGLIGAAFFAFAPLAIQQSHFFVVDPFMTFFVVAALYAAVRIVQEGRTTDYALAGLALGLAMASKPNALLIAPVIAAAAGVRLWPLVSAWLSEHRTPPSVRDEAWRPAIGLLVAGLIALLAFRVAQPYAFETPSLTNLGLALDNRWLDDQRSQTRILGGDVGFPPSLQWTDRASYLYPVTEMVRWGMGPAFGIAGWIGLTYASYRLIRRRDLRHLLPLVFALVYFGFMGRQFSLYMRYFLPMYPVLALLAGYTLVELLRGASAISKRVGNTLPLGLARGAVALILVATLLLGLAYASIYSRPGTRIEASRWIHANLPASAAIATEHWDETIPFAVPDVPQRRFEYLTLNVYEPDLPTKALQLIETLDRVDYIVVSSNRASGSIPRNPIAYPVTSRYYDALFAGELGFRELRSFTSYPGLLGIELPDGATQESWTSYDHPRVTIFEKAPDYTRARLEDALGRGPFVTGGLTPAQAERNGLQLSPADLATQRAGGTWTDVFATSGIAVTNPTLLWLLALEAMSLAATPLVLLVCRRLPDRGYLLAKPLGLVVLAYPVWLLVSLKVVHFEQTTIIAVLALLIAAATATAWFARHELVDWLGANWRLVLFSEALFLVAFLFFRELRLENPDLWHPYRGGEKPMDLAYLTAVTRSTTLPPFDPWFSGGYINYYYLGHFFTAVISKLTTIPPEVTFNLAVPTFFAMTAGAAFSLSYNLAAASRRFFRRAPSFGALPRWSLYGAGVLGAVFVALAGNLDGVAQLSANLSAVSPWHLDFPIVGGVVNSIGGAWQVIVHGADLKPFDFWRSSRMLPPTISITEFPYFSFLFADLHAHMIAIAFDLLAVALGLSLVLGRRSERGAWQEWGLIALLGLVVGSLRWLNSWDYPPFLLLSCTAVLISERRLEGGILPTTARAVVKCFVLVGLSVLLFKPFLDSYATPVSGLHASPETTPLHQYLAHFGVFVAAITGWLAFLTWRSLRSLRFALYAPDSKGAFVVLAAGGLAIGSLIFALKGEVLIGALLPALGLVVGLAIRELFLRRPDGGLRLFLLALVGLALGLSIGVDLVTINGDIIRMNTVFKFYLHVWLLYAVVAAYAVWYLAVVILPAVLRSSNALRLPKSEAQTSTDSASPMPPVSIRGTSSRLAGRALAGTTAMAMLFLVLATLIYPAMATPVRLDDRFADLPPTLDGLAYMNGAVYNDPKGTPLDLSQDLEGIEWLRRNVQGTPAIVEGRTDLYRWGGRISINTGLPTVLGWDWHQRQQRGELAYMIDGRAVQVDAFYAGTDIDQARRFLAQYDVEYVILGQVERLYYPPAGMPKFATGLDGALEVVFRNAGLTIYRVRQDTLAAGPVLLGLP